MLIGESDESSVLFVRSRASSWFRYSANDSITSTSLSSLLSKPVSNAVSTMRSQQVSGYLTPRSGRCNSCGFVFVLICLEEVQLYIRHSVRRRWCAVEKFRDDCPPCAGNRGADSAPSVCFRCRQRLQHVTRQKKNSSSTAAVRRCQYDSIYNSCCEAIPESASRLVRLGPDSKAYNTSRSAPHCPQQRLKCTPNRARVLQSILNRMGSYSLFG